MGVLEHRTHGEWLDIFNEAYHRVGLVHKNHINRKSHKKHMNLMTWRYYKRFAWGDLCFIEKAD